MAGVAAALNFTSNNTSRPSSAKTSSLIEKRNTKSFNGSDGPNGRTRKVAGQGTGGPVRPPSPHLLRVPPPHASRFASDPEDPAALEADAAAREEEHLQLRCDALERLLLRKVASKQELPGAGGREHVLGHCQQCTVEAARGGGGRSARYAHERRVHDHAHLEARHRVVAPAKGLKPHEVRAPQRNGEDGNAGGNS